MGIVSSEMCGSSLKTAVCFCRLSYDISLRLELKKKKNLRKIHNSSFEYFVFLPSDLVRENWMDFLFYECVIVDQTWWRWFDRSPRFCCFMTLCRSVLYESWMSGLISREPNPENPCRQEWICIKTKCLFMCFGKWKLKFHKFMTNSFWQSDDLRVLFWYNITISECSLDCVYTHVNSALTLKDIVTQILRFCWYSGELIG